MQKVRKSKNLEDLYKKTIDENLFDHTCQFFEQESGTKKPYGSGVFVLIHDVHFIFTASHVADALSENKKDLYIQVGIDTFINVIGKVKYTDLQKSEGIDLAYIKLDKEMIPYLIENYKFLTTERIRKHNNLLFGAANYCVIGFPENNISHENGALKTSAQVYFTFPTNENPYKYYKLNKDYWIILSMTGKAEDVETKEKLPMNTHFYGLSGCGLWLLMPNIEENR